MKRLAYDKFFRANRHDFRNFSPFEATGEQATSRRLLSIAGVFRSASPDPSCFLPRDFRASACARPGEPAPATCNSCHVARRSSRAPPFDATHACCELAATHKGVRLPSRISR